MGDRPRDVPPPGVSHERPPRMLSKAELCEQWARAACGEDVVSACQASSAADCRLTQAELCQSIAPDQLATDGVDGCIAAVAAAYRDAELDADELNLVLRFSGACARTIVGPNAAGADCVSPRDCDLSRGYTCVVKGEGSGSCQVPELVEPGRSCTEAAQTCSDGFFCDGSHCVETLAEGEPCILHSQCAADGYCNDAGACAARLAVNEPCESDEWCARGVCTDLDGQRVCTDRVILSRADPLCANLR
ncbi:MAG: hypothetical protein ABW321_08285 [Polyangiales bacterium]